MLLMFHWNTYWPW